MNTNDVLTKLKAEIERRKNICEGVFERESDTYYQGKAVAYGELLTFLSTLESKEPDKSLEETAADFVWDVMENDYYGPSELSKRLRPTSKLDDFYGALAEIFIAGAKWKEGQLLKGSPLPEDTVLFQKGVEEGRRLEREDIMKDAVECSVYAGKEGGKWIVSYIGNYESMMKICKDGDKVRIIIVKEEDKQ